jgi:hypothetical protein
MCKPLEKCRSGKDFIAYAKHHHAEVRNGKGSHCIVKTFLGQTVVPLHREIADGLRAKLVKTFILIGLACLVVMIFVAI